MKLKADETIEKSLEKLIARTKKPSFNNNKGLTKIKQYIILDSIEFLQQVLDSENSNKSLNKISKNIKK
jgi:hypothetical protein